MAQTNFYDQDGHPNIKTTVAHENNKMIKCILAPLVTQVVLLLLLCQILPGYCTVTQDADNSLIIKSQGTIVKGSLEGIEGQTFTATCFANRDLLANSDSPNLKKAPLSLEWSPARDLASSSRIMQVNKDNFTVVLTIARLNRSDAGFYKCVMTKADHEVIERRLELFVKPEDEITDVCGITRFRCSVTNVCIFSRYMCDGVVDCSKDGTDVSDESEQVCKTVNPCEQKFMCNNSRCIDPRLVCDNADSCGDNSDEVYGCQQKDTMNSAPTTSKSGNEENEHFNWLKATVYTIIGCTVATVMLISFIVIIVFRLKMKRLRARRMANQVERHRRHMGEGTSDQDPFLAFNTHSHFGNIIVNVNNGVQCVGGSVFQRDKPPPYSEVVNRSDFAPPPYSTIDRANRRQMAGGDGDSLASSIRGGASPSGFSGMALIGPPLSHPAREHYLQHAAAAAAAAAAANSSTANSSPAGSMLALSEIRSVSQRNSTASDGVGHGSIYEVQTPLLPPPPPTPPPPTPPRSARSRDEPAAPPVPPARTTSILDSGTTASSSPDEFPPPLPPRNDETLTQPRNDQTLPPPPPPVSTPSLPPPTPPDTPTLPPPSPPTTPSLPPPTPLATPSPPTPLATPILPPPTPLCCATPSLPPPTPIAGFPSLPTQTSSLPRPPSSLPTPIPAPSPASQGATPASPIAPKDLPTIPPPCFSGSLGRGGNLMVQEGKIILTPNVCPAPTGSAASTPGHHRDCSSLPHSSKLEVRDGKIMLSVAKDEEQGAHGGGCELQVKDGKILFKR